MVLFSRSMLSASLLASIIFTSLPVTNAFQQVAPFALKKPRSYNIVSDVHPAMKMVAGGAERAYGDEYYDGKVERVMRFMFYPFRIESK